MISDCTSHYINNISLNPNIDILEHVTKISWLVFCITGMDQPDGKICFIQACEESDHCRGREEQV